MTNILKELTKKNLKLNRKRTVVTIIGITLATALLMAVVTMYTSLIDSLINYIKFSDGDYHEVFYNVEEGDIDRFAQNRKVEKVFYTKGIGYAVLDKSENEYKPYAYVMEFSETALKDLSIKLTEGRLPENDNEIVIPAHLKTNGKIDLKIGDKVTLDVGKRMSEGYELDQNNPLLTGEDDDEELTDDGELVDETGLVDAIDASTGERIETVSSKEPEAGVDGEPSQDSETEPDVQPQEEITDTVSKTYTVVGIIERPSYKIEPYSAPGYTFISLMQDENFTGKTNVYLRFSKAGLKDIYKTTAGLMGIDEELYNAYMTGMYKEGVIDANLYNKAMEAIRMAKYRMDLNYKLVGLEREPLKLGGPEQLNIPVIIVLIIIIITSVYCIKNSFEISITEKRKQYGMLKSVGATKKQIRHNVLYEAFILARTGIFAGLLLGAAASYILIIVCNILLKDAIAAGFDMSLKFTATGTVLSVILSLVTIFLSAIVGAAKAARISPIELVRNSGQIKLNRKKMKSPAFIRKIFGVGGDISYKNIKRNHKKYRTTIVSIVVSVGVFITVSSFVDLAFYFVKSQVDLQGSDIMLSVNTHNDEDEVAAVHDTVKLNNIELYTIERSSIHFEVGSEHASKDYKEIVYADSMPVDEDEFMVITMVSLGDRAYREFLKETDISYEKAADKGVLVDNNLFSYYDSNNKYSEKRIRNLDYKAGDIIESTDDKKINIEVAGVTAIKPFGIKYEEPMLIVSDEIYDKYIAGGIIDKNVEGPYDYVRIYFKSSDPEKLQEDIEISLQDYKDDIYIYNNAAEMKKLNNLFTLIAIFLYGFITVITLIGITNIFNTITTSVELRRREFAMLKSVGMTGHEFNRMMSFESLFMGIKALIFGIPLGLVLSYVLYRYLAEGMTYRPPVGAVLISIIAVFVLIFGLMRYSLGKTKRLNTIETIRNENI